MSKAPFPAPRLQFILYLYYIMYKISERKYYGDFLLKTTDFTSVYFTDITVKRIIHFININKYWEENFRENERLTKTKD
jgi:hypothetical protein